MEGVSAGLIGLLCIALGLVAALVAVVLVMVMRRPAPSSDANELADLREEVARLREEVERLKTGRATGSTDIE